MKVGNTTDSLQPKIHEAEISKENFEQFNVYAQLQQKAAVNEAAKTPTPSPTHPPTGPAPVPYTPPTLGRKSTAGPTPEEYTGTSTAAVTVGISSSLATRVAALEERLENFNKRSGQKI